MKDYLLWLKRNRLILLGFVFGIAFYFVDAAVDALLFSDENLLELVLNPEPFEIYMRGAVFIIAVAFGVHAHTLLRNAELVGFSQLLS